MQQHDQGTSNTLEPSDVLLFTYTQVKPTSFTELNHYNAPLMRNDTASDCHRRPMSLGRALEVQHLKWTSFWL